VVTSEEVKSRIEALAESNWKVKNLLRDVGAFHTWNDTLQAQMLKMIKVQRISCPDTGATHFEELAA